MKKDRASRARRKLMFSNRDDYDEIIRKENSTLDRQHSNMTAQVILADPDHRKGRYGSKRQAKLKLFGARSAFYNPAWNIAKSISDALNPNKVLSTIPATDPKKVRPNQSGPVRVLKASSPTEHSKPFDMELRRASLLFHDGKACRKIFWFKLTVVRETTRGVQFIYQDRRIWLPRFYLHGPKLGRYGIPMWLAVKKGMMVDK